MFETAQVRADQAPPWPRKDWHGSCFMFLIVGLIAGALGIYGVAAIASQIAWVLFLVGIVLLVIHLISGRPRQVI
jgi:uncharacterized membrane protein YtjA (UPF0391 family)